MTSLSFCNLRHGLGRVAATAAVVRWFNGIDWVDRIWFRNVLGTESMLVGWSPVSTGVAVYEVVGIRFIRQRRTKAVSRAQAIDTGSCPSALVKLPNIFGHNASLREGSLLVEDALDCLLGASTFTVTSTLGLANIHIAGSVALAPGVIFANAKVVQLIDVTSIDYGVNVNEEHTFLRQG